MLLEMAVMAGNGWKFLECLEIAGNCWKFLEMAGMAEMAENVWKWL